MTDRGLDEPVPDALEQKQDAIPETGEPEENEIPEHSLEHVPLEADSADVAEQAREVDPGDDDYR